ncbi:MAG: DUF3829 domain-containing protein [Pseudomonadota bacterium]
MKLKKVAFLLALVVASSCTLSACKKVSKLISSDSGTSSATASNAGSNLMAAKAAQYAEGYNTLIGTSGLKATYAHYLKADIDHATVSKDLSITDGSIEIALNQLTAGRAIASTQAPALDQAADQLIVALGKLNVQLKELEPYYKSKAYKDDNFAKGKAAHAAMIANFDAASSASHQFSKNLDEHENANAKLRLQSLKEKGEMLAYSTALSLSQAKEILSLFEEESSVKNPDILKRADALITQLEANLAEQRKEYAKANTATSGAKPDVDYQLAESHLTSMVGAYRNLKQSGKAKDVNSMVSAYNNAVHNSNSIRD